MTQAIDGFARTDQRRHAVVAPEISASIYGRALMGFTEGVSFLV